MVVTSEELEAGRISVQ